MGIRAYGIIFLLSLLQLVLSTPDLMKRADTPDFYLVASTFNPSTNLKPVRFDSSGYLATLSGPGAPLKLNFNAGESARSQSGSFHSFHVLRSTKLKSLLTETGNLQIADGSKAAYVQFATG